VLTEAAVVEGAAVVCGGVFVDADVEVKAGFSVIVGIHVLVGAVISVLDGEVFGSSGDDVGVTVLDVSVANSFIDVTEGSTKVGFCVET
jgi:hypothetical protein